MHPNILIKVSGDLVKNEHFRAFTRDKAKRAHVVVIVGGGTQISKKLTAEGYSIGFNNGVRHHPSLESRKIARSVLEEIQADVQDNLPGCCEIIIPCIKIGSVICHVNADDYFRILIPNFDKSYLFTLQGRRKDFENAEIIYVKDD